MEEKRINAKKWMYWFSLSIAVILIYKLLDNFTNITSWIDNLLNVLAPFIGGILLAYILYLPCKKIEELFQKNKKKKFLYKYARVLSLIIIYILVFIIIAIILNCIIPTVIQSSKDLISNVPIYYQKVIEKINNLPEDNILRSETAQNIIEKINDIDIKSFFNIERLTQYAKGVISAVNGIFNVFIAVIVSIYILAQRKAIVKFLGKFTHAIFEKKDYIKISKYFRNGNEIFFKFLTSQIIDAIIVGILVSIAMLILGVKYAVLLGFMIGIFNLIPYFGAIIAVIIAVIITILTGGIGQATLMTIIVVILQQIDANIINPKIVGNSLKISQLLIIFAVTIGGAYSGILGMFLAVPIVAIIKMILDDFIEEKEKKKELM